MANTKKPAKSCISSVLVSRLQLSHEEWLHILQDVRKISFLVCSLVPTKIWLKYIVIQFCSPWWAVTIKVIRCLCDVMQQYFVSVKEFCKDVKAHVKANVKIQLYLLHNMWLCDFPWRIVRIWCVGLWESAISIETEYKMRETKFDTFYNGLNRQ